MVSLMDICMKPLSQACATQSLLQIQAPLDPSTALGGFSGNNSEEELLPLVRSQNLTLAFSSEISIEEELKRESTADAITIMISYLVMFAYISLTLGDTPRFTAYYISSKAL